MEVRVARSTSCAGGRCHAGHARILTALPSDTPYRTAVCIKKRFNQVYPTDIAAIMQPAEVVTTPGKW